MRQQLSIPLGSSTPDGVEGLSWLNRVEYFRDQLPYRQGEFASRAWGHKLHSLCSYQGKLKPAIAYWLVQLFVPQSGKVLDPLGGVGTIPFEAALAGRAAVSNDKSPLAAVVGAAKLDPPTLHEAMTEMESWRKSLSKTALRKSDFESAEFGLNAKVSDYYHPETLAEILKARQIFLAEGFGNRARTFIWASLLHVLHGNRPYCLSRNSHPITPFNPTGPTEYKSVVEKVTARIGGALADGLPREFVPGVGLQGDFRDLALRKSEFDAIITSPPFLGMRFDRPNWLRLWFCGWEASTFHQESLSFLERQQTKSMDCYEDFFECAHSVLKSSGLVIIHIGTGKTDNMAKSLVEIAQEKFELVSTVTEDVESCEKHGLKDKGRTTHHHFLFMRPRHLPRR